MIEDKVGFIAGMIIAFIVLVFVVLIFFGSQRMFDKQDFIKDNCVATDLRVIGNKGHVETVYDCGGGI